MSSHTALTAASTTGEQVGHAPALTRDAGEEPSVPGPVTPPQRRGGWWVLVALAFAAGGVVAVAVERSRPDPREALPDAPPAPARGSEAVLVTAEPVTLRPVQRTVDGVGTLHGFEEVTITAKVEGRVRAVHRDVADRVRPGELLVEIEAADHELAVQQDERGLQVELAKLGLQQPPDANFDLTKVPSVVQAQARLENAKLRLDRSLKGRASGAVAAEEADTATAEHRTAEAEYANQLLLARAGLATAQLKQAALAASRLKLGETRVLAPTPTRPVPGLDAVTYVVTARGVSEGTMIRAGTEVCKLAIDRALKLRVPVPERFGPEVRVGQAVEVTTAASPKPVAGTVARTNPAVDPATRTFEVEVLVPNPGGELRPGSFAKAAILTRLDAAAVTVPLTAPYSFAGTTRVFLVEGGKAREVPVTLGVQAAGWVEVADPALPSGAQVITSGHAVLADGTAVAVRGTP